MKYLKNLNFTKLMVTLISVLFMGITLSVLRIIDYGMDPFSFMNVSIADKIGWTLGNWQMLFNIIMFIPVIVWGRKYIGLGTLFNMILIGYTVDFCTWLWGVIGLSALFGHMAVKIAVMLITVVLFVFSAATYMSTGFGTSPFDALPLMISEKLPKLPFKLIRFCWDASAVVIGFAFGGKVGVVTILMVLFLGQAVEMVRKIIR